MRILACLLFIGTSGLAQNAPTELEASAPAASPAQNRRPQQLPPPGIPIAEKDRTELTEGAAALATQIATLKAAKLPREMAELLPDVEIFHKAVDWALRHDEFYDPKQVATARKLLEMGTERANALLKGQAPWLIQTGPVVRGYRSRIDGSIQPFGVQVPAGSSGPADTTPLWVWNHGRGDTLSELAFLARQLKGDGPFTPENTFVLHPYGRYCNATKFAGEQDVFEALATVNRSYPATRRVWPVNAGFSMGGASAWHLAVHHPDSWCASHAGAGFAESAEYAGVFAPGKTPPPWWEVILYRWYDATVCAANLGSHPMIAYHGSQDKQGQSTVIMKRFAEKEGVTFEEVVGPGVGHQYEPAAKARIAEFIQPLSILQTRGTPQKYRFVTYSLIYPRFIGGRLTALEKSWQRAELRYELKPDGSLHIQTQNVAGFTLGSIQSNGVVFVDGARLLDHLGWIQNFQKINGNWEVSPQGPPPPTRGVKNPAVCGPIDHAFMNSFLFVKPTGPPLNTKLGEWQTRELAHATKQWRGIFRGDAPSVDDTQLTDDQIRDSNLVLWGDPSSNPVLRRILDQLPLKWNQTSLEFGGASYDASTHLPILIFPNPLNPERYVVLNSGFTFSRSAASGTNSLQTPKLPDWAIVDTSSPPDDKFPGKIVEAGFFDEHWKFTSDRPR